MQSLLSNSIVTYIIVGAIGLAAFGLALLIVWLVSLAFSVKLQPAQQKRLPPKNGEAVDSKRELLIKVVYPYSPQNGAPRISAAMRELKEDKNKYIDTLVRKDFFDRIEQMRQNPIRYPVSPYYNDSDAPDLLICGERFFCAVPRKGEGSVFDAGEEPVKQLLLRLNTERAQCFSDIALIKQEELGDDFYIFSIEKSGFQLKKEIYAVLDCAYDYTREKFYTDNRLSDEFLTQEGLAEQSEFRGSGKL